MWIRRLKYWLESGKRSAALTAEMEAHLAEKASEFEEQGMTPEQARSEARKRFGNVALKHEASREIWMIRFWSELVQDARYGLRTMATNKTFSVMAILSLALGIGANTAIFSFMEAILLRSLPVPDPESLVILSWRTPVREWNGSNRHNNSFREPGGGFVGGIFAYQAFELLRKNDAVFSTVFGYQGAGNLNLKVNGEAELERMEYVSGEYFRGLGVPPASGRLIGPEDDRAGTPGMAVISYALSQRRFGGPERAPGQSIVINNKPFTVAGVTPPEFFGVDPGLVPDVYLPMHANLLLDRNAAAFYSDSDLDWVVPMARLRPGVTRLQAQAAAGPQFSEWARTSRPKRRADNVPTLLVREGAGGLDSLRRMYSKPIYILFGLVGLILCIACANVANLYLARAGARRREIALRLSLGAGRVRIVRQLLTESILLALFGGAFGVVFAVWAIRFLTGLLAGGRDNFTMGAELNWPALLVVAGLFLLSRILFGLAPAVQATKKTIMPALKESRTGETHGRGSRSLGMNRVLMVSQIAFTLLILVAAGLFVRTLSKLASIQLGFNRENLLTFALNARQAGHKDPEIATFYNNMRTQFSGIPGVNAASLSGHTLIGMGTSSTDVSAAGGPPLNSNILPIGKDFLGTMQIPLLLGRTIDERDRRGAPMVAVVNEAFAMRGFGHRNPIGEHIVLEAICRKCDFEIVGVAANTLYGDLREDTPPPTVYLPFEQARPADTVVYELRTVGNPLVYVSAVRDIVRRADSGIPVADVKTQSARIDNTINQEIMFARLCTAFAALALLIACAGLYGSMAYNVSRRTAEIGIRIALGAQRGQVLSMILREVILLSVLGLGLGVSIALAASKLVESFLFKVKPNDPAALIGSVMALMIAAIVAGYMPARRASQIDPMSALRQE